MPATSSRSRNVRLLPRRRVALRASHPWSLAWQAERGASSQPHAGQVQFTLWWLGSLPSLPTMDDIESRRAASSSATQDKKRQRRRGNRNRFPTSSNASIQPSQPQPPLPPAAPEIKPSGLNGLFDDDHGGEAQPIATSSKSPISLNDASPSSSSCDEGKPPLIATSATPPHKRRKKKGSSVQLQETLPTQQQATHAVPIMGGVRARMMAQDKERQEYRLDEEQDTQASQDEAVVPASAASQAAYKQLEKSLADARKARSDADAELTRLRNEMRFKVSHRAPHPVSSPA